MRAALVIGTRPQIIKSAPIIRAAADFPEVKLEIVHTGQHYDYSMSREFFNELSLPDPAVNLSVGSGPHGWQTGQMLIGLEKAFTELKPDVVLVPGDTNSTLAGALVASKMHIRLAHVESGARSYDRGMPEEINRTVVDHISDLLFVVSRNCKTNLLKEGITGRDIRLVGDTMYESIRLHAGDIEMQKAAAKYGLERRRYAVLTLHRAENTDDETRLRRILTAIKRIDMPVVFPCHPRTKSRIDSLGLLPSLGGNLLIVEPVPYFEMLSLVKDSAVTLTDSGGLQKEACWLGAPCVTLRDTTEWGETVEAGVNILVGSDENRIVKAVEKFVTSPIRTRRNLFGSSNTSRKIVQEILKVA